MKSFAEILQEQLLLLSVLTRFWQAASTLFVPALQLLLLPDLYPAKEFAFDVQVEIGVVHVGSTYRPVTGLALMHIIVSFPAVFENWRGVPELGLFCWIDTEFTPSK